MRPFHNCSWPSMHPASRPGAGRPPGPAPSPGGNHARAYSACRPDRVWESPAEPLLNQPPEVAGGVAADLFEQIVDVTRRGAQLVDVEPEVAVAPVRGPGLAGGGVTHTSDREAGPFRPVIFAPGSPPLDDREMPRANLALDAHPIKGMVGHPCGAPPPHAHDIKLRQRHQLTSRPEPGPRR